jgi:hypothetical protein
MLLVRPPHEPAREAATSKNSATRLGSSRQASVVLQARRKGESAPISALLRCARQAVANGPVSRDIPGHSPRRGRSPLRPSARRLIPPSRLALVCLSACLSRGHSPVPVHRQPRAFTSALILRSSRDACLRSVEAAGSRFDFSHLNSTLARGAEPVKSNETAA